MSDVLVEHAFRHEYARLVAVLSRQVGIEHLAMVEDAVQGALLQALESWTVGGPPDKPCAWLYWVARNRVMDDLRRGTSHRRLLAQHARELPDPSDDEALAPLPGEIQDDLLRMLFACCDERIPSNSQVALALKVLCGFGVAEIAVRLFTSPANVYKRLARARAHLRRHPNALTELDEARYESRLATVHRVLYVLFTEGYLSSRAECAIRRELCDEAIRLTTALSDHPRGQNSQTYALLALMHLHRARTSARECERGTIAARRARPCHLGSSTHCARPRMARQISRG